MLLLPLLDQLLVLLPCRVCFMLHLLLVLLQCLLLPQLLLLIEDGSAHILRFSAAAVALKVPSRVDKAGCSKVGLRPV